MIPPESNETKLNPTDNRIKNFLIPIFLIKLMLSPNFLNYFNFETVKPTQSDPTAFPASITGTAI